MGRRPSLLSMVKSTCARPKGARPEVPAKMTSAIFAPRSVFAPCSPITHAKASTTLDFPEPFGPTTQVIPGSRRRVVALAKDLNPLSESVLRCTNLSLKLPEDIQQNFDQLPCPWSISRTHRIASSRSRPCARTWMCWPWRTPKDMSSKTEEASTSLIQTCASIGARARTRSAAGRACRPAGSLTVISSSRICCEVISKIREEDGSRTTLVICAISVRARSAKSMAL